MEFGETKELIRIARREKPTGKLLVQVLNTTEQRGVEQVKLSKIEKMVELLRKALFTLNDTLVLHATCTFNTAQLNKCRTVEGGAHLEVSFDVRKRTHG